MFSKNLQLVRRGEPMNQSEGIEVEEPWRYGGLLSGNNYATSQMPLRRTAVVSDYVSFCAAGDSLKNSNYTAY